MVSLRSEFVDAECLYVGEMNVDTIKRLVHFVHLYNNYAETNGKATVCSCVLTEVKKQEEGSNLLPYIGGVVIFVCLLAGVLFFKNRWRFEPNRHLAGEYSVLNQINVSPT